MVYYIQTRDNWVRVDYPCYGILCEMEELSSTSWEYDVQRWCDVENDWVNFEHQHWSQSQGYTHLPGFKPEDISAIFTPNCDKITELPNHKMFKHISLTTNEEAGIPDSEVGEHFFRLDMAEVPCDELFIPMFMIRNLFSGSGNSSTLYNMLRKDGYSHLEAIIFANVWYRSVRSHYDNGGMSTSVVYYPDVEDGAVFSQCKVGDVVRILNGESPKFMSAHWGSLKRGYPSYGNLDGEDEEEFNPFTHRKHHMSDCTILQSSYPPGFLNTHLNNGSYFSEEELKDFIKEIMKHVEQGT